MDKIIAIQQSNHCMFGFLVNRICVKLIKNDANASFLANLTVAWLFSGSIAIHTGEETRSETTMDEIQAE